MPYPDNRRRLIFLLKQLGVAALYALLIHVGHRFFEDDATIGFLETGSGFALAMLLIGGKRYAWGVFLGALLANTMVFPFWKAVIISWGDTLEALCGAWLLMRGSKFDPALQSLRDYLRLLFQGGVISAGITANIVAVALLASGFIAPAEFFHELADWWTGDILGIVMVTPLILVCWHARKERLETRQAAEAALLLGLMFLAGQVVFIGWFQDSLSNVKQSYWMFLFVVWVAARLGPRGTVIALAMIDTQALLGALHGTGFFANIAQTSMVNYWIYTLALSVVGMALATFISERRQAEEKLQRSERKFRTLYDSTNDAVMLLNEKGFFDCNQATLSMIGCATKEEFCSKHPADLSPPEQPCGTSSFKLANQHIATAMEKGSHRFEWTSKRADNGKVFLADVLLSALELEGRTVVQAVIRDITERKKAEKLLSESENKYRTLIELAGDAIFLADTVSGIIIECNVNAARLTGRTKEEIVGLHQSELHPPDKALLYKEIFREHIESGKAISEDVLVVHKDGHTIPVDIHATVFELDGVQVILGIFRDITERKRAEKSLRESKEKLRAYLDNISDTIWVIDKNLNIAYVSSGVARLLGVLPEGLIGQPSSFVIHTDDMSVIDDAQRYVMEHPGEPYTVQYRIGHKDGRWITVESTGVNMLSNPAINGVLVSMRDISERKRAESELRERNMQLGAMAMELTRTEERERQVIAQELHDGLSQALAVAKLKLSLLDCTGRNSLKREVAAIENLVDQSNQAVRSLSLQLSPPVLGERRLEPVLEWLADEMQGSYGLRVNVRIDGLSGHMDKTILSLIFRAARELLTNVAKHARIDMAELAAIREEDRLVISVTDNGAGFDAHAIPVPSDKGGYGLFSMYERIGLIGGDMHIDSSPGDGAVVVLTLPLAAEQGEAKK